MTKNKTKFNKVEIITKFSDAGISLKVKKYVNHGVQLQFDNGAKINVFKTGNISIQGKDIELSNTIIYGQPVRSTVEELDVNVDVGVNVCSATEEDVKQDENLGVSNGDDDLPPW